MKTRLLDAALEYISLGFSIIPIRPDKRPLIKWEEFQKRKATEDEVKAWWGKWPSAMIGIVTGSISGVVVIDVDEPQGQNELSRYILDSLLIPVSQTPRGGQHLYFLAPKEPIPGNVRAIPGCDLRAEGNYIIAPPSVNGIGQAYAWLPGLSITEVDPPSLPASYILLINKYACKGYVGNAVNDNHRQHLTTNDNILFTLGRRDNDLFHVANCLFKGGMPKNEVSQVLKYLANSCTPPFPEKELSAKIESALRRVEVRERNLTQEIREWVLTTSGNFLTTDVYLGQHLTTREEKKKCVVILSRLVDEGIIERSGNKNGCFRRIESDCEEIDFIHAPDDRLDLRLPLGIERYVKILPKNIIIIAGEPNAGKTAYLLNFVRLNMAKHKVHYFSSEMGAMELRDRLNKFEVPPLDKWIFSAKERSSNFADVIRPDEINIIDFLEMSDEFYKVGGHIKEVFDKLQRGIAFIAIQKNRGTDYGLGGMRSLEKARLYLAMEPGKIKIVKAKNWVSQTNPNGLEIDFKLVQGCKFITESDWHKAQ